MVIYTTVTWRAAVRIEVVEMPLYGRGKWQRDSKQYLDLECPAWNGLVFGVQMSVRDHASISLPGQ